MKKFSVTFGVDEDKDQKTLSPSFVDVVRCDAMKDISKCYGGVTMSRNNGAWLNERGALVEERAFTLSVVDIQEKGDKEIKRIAENIKYALRQSSVLLVSEEVDAKFI